MGNNCLILLLVLAFLISGCSSASASPPSAAKIVGGIVTNVASAVFKCLWSLKSTSKTAISSRSMMKFESGYTVETVFDGSKHGIEPYSVEMSPSGELLVLDSENSNIYKISTTPLSRYSRPKLVTGSPEGYSGHVDGRPREARLNHPKGLTMDERGNVYVADTMNMAIRKISDTGVVTIAGGGKRSRGGGHVDGPSEDAKFSDDFDIVYVGSSCSLLVVDRGNQAIREIQLHDDDCSSYEYEGNLHLGGAVLVAACFFGYMLALLQRRISSMFSSEIDSTSPPHGKGMSPAPYQKAHKSIRPTLIPPPEGLFGSLGRLFSHTGSSVVEILGGLFSGGKKRQHYHPNHGNCSWPVQESFVIPDDDEPPPPAVESRDPTPRKSYPFMSKELERCRHYNTNRQNHPFYGGGWNSEVPQQLQKHHQHHHQQQQYHQKHQSSRPQTYYEQSCETNEIVFGAVQVQEQGGRREAMVIEAVDYGDPIYNHHNIRSRYNYMGYSYGGYN